jgi:hypothetical protein
MGTANRMTLAGKDFYKKFRQYSFVSISLFLTLQPQNATQYKIKRNDYIRPTKRFVGTRAGVGEVPLTSMLKPFS